MLDNARTEYWTKELDAVTRERLLREARAAVATGNLKTAYQKGVRLLQRAGSPEGARRLLQAFVEALGDMSRDIERSEKVIRELAKDKTAQETGFDFAEALDRFKTGKRPMKFEESNRQWTQALSQTVTQVVDYLPARRESGEPTVEQQQRFVHEAMAILRASLANDGDPEPLIDAFMVLMEFSPTDPPDVESLVGVEPRMFLNLGLRAKLCAVRGLARLGESEALRKRVLHLAESPEGAGRMPMLAAMMGGLRHTDFLPFLKNAMRQAKSIGEEAPIIDALGRIAHPEAIDTLMAALQSAMKKSVDPKEVRHAKILITALGRVSRSKDLDPALRNQLVKRVVAAVGDRNASLAFHVASMMFSINVDALDLELREWATRVSMRAMLHRDTGENLRLASQSPLGFRAPMVNTLKVLGKPCLPIMIEEAAPHAGQFSGAFPAFAEVMQTVGDERAVPVLEMMIRTTFHRTEDPEANSILKEQVLDPATGQMKDLDRDDILHTLLFTLEKIGGEKGRRMILAYADQVQAGQLPPAGQAASSLLIEAKRRAGTLGKREEQTDIEPEDMPSPEEIKKALSAAKGGLLTKAKDQIFGLATLGRARDPETIPVILRALQAKDKNVYNAAETALIQFVTPPPSPKQFEQIVSHLFDEKKLLRGETLDRLLEVVTRAFPKNPPYSDIFRRRVRVELDESPEQVRLLAAVAQAKRPAQRPEPSENGETSEENGAQMPDINTAEGRLQLLEAKRRYLKERKEWIQRGKHGPAPAPPPGVDLS